MSNRPVHVAALFRHYHPILTGSGERFRRYAPELARQNISIDIHTSEVEGSPHHESGPPTIYRHPTGNTSTSRMDVALLNAARLKYAQSSDVPKVLQVISCSPPFLLQILRWKITSKLRVVFVGTMVEPARSPKGLLEKFKNYCNGVLFCNCVDHIIASSSTMAQGFLSEKVTMNEITVIPNGVDTKRFSPVKHPTEKLALREKLGIPCTTRVTLFVGNLIARKGIDKLLEAWALMTKSPKHAQDLLVVIGPRERPTFVGHGQQQALHDFHDKLDAAVSKIPKQNIKFFDPVENIEDFFNAADLFAFPSLKEGMGNVIMEAMACGLPVATTPFYGFPKTEFGREGSEHLKLDFDPEIMAQQLSDALLDPDRLTRIGSNARSWTVKHLGIEATLDQFAEVYHKLAED